MNKGRRILNISLIVVSILLTGWTVRIFRQSSPSYTVNSTTMEVAVDSPAISAATDIIVSEAVEDTSADTIRNTATTTYKSGNRPSDKTDVKATRLRDTDIRVMTGTHPFRDEARKVLGGNLQETDSLNRRHILNYCEHLRTSYTTRDIDFLRQVFSDDALIIVGHMVRSADTHSLKGSPKVTYSVRTKKEYLDRLAKIFNSGKEISLDFSGFRIMRHPTMEGIYGVTLRQRYAAGNYSDEGWLFLLWDFRNPSMPLIHVRTWQPSRSIAGEDDLIDMSDFNLE